MGETEDRVHAAAVRIFRTHQAAEAFLNLHCPELGGATPLALMRDGRAEEVLTFLERLEREAPAPKTGVFGSWLGRLGGSR